ncbi:bifunctional riboflavin kinase/FAD synthetase [bacterium]|nr:bifunctional riboflavin kinase/FAD synthetase [bacterium]
MKIFRSADDIPFYKRSVLTVGTFDGVHLGHQALLRSLLATSGQFRARSVVITFDPHPMHVLGTGKGTMKLLSTSREKIELFRSYGVSRVLIMPFTESLAQMEADAFIRDILLKKIGCLGLIMGFNNTLGKDQKGDMPFLEKMGERHHFFVHQVSPVKIDSVAVSSTAVRNALNRGDAEQARRLLGRPYSVEGDIVHGMKVGRRLGFPTANIRISEDKLVPRDGVYAVLVLYKRHYLQGVANIGTSPTIPGKTWSVEIYIENFTEIIYNKGLKIEFISRLREERQFSSEDALKKQIQCDKEKALKILAPYIRR